MSGTSGDDQVSGDTGAAGRHTVNAAWDDVGARFADLGRLLKERQQQRAPGSEEESEPSAPDAQASDASASGGPAREVIDTIDDAFTALGDAVRDPAFQQQARGTLDAFGSALGVTFAELGEHLRARFGRGDEGAPPLGMS